MKLFLSHKIDIYDFSESIYLGVFEDGTVERFSIQEIIDYPNEIITYEVRCLLNQIRKNYKGKIPKITDFSQIVKINAGRSKKSYPKGKYPWLFWNRINRDIGAEEAKNLYTRLREETSEDEIIPSLEFLAKKLKEYYDASIVKIQESNQIDRFNDLENEIQQILHKRQIEGIHIDESILKDLVTKLEVNKNALINKLRYKYSLIDLNYKSIRLFLIDKGFKISRKDYNYFNLLSYLKTTKITSEICKDIYITLRVKSDYEKLKQYITEEGDLIHPEFDCIGTITSRILINYPHIQQLKKENRIIFKAKEGFTLLYCDFNQFEPCILASFSKDDVMIDLYNSEDIYTNFSEYIFGNKALRKEAKVLFLSYLYGMSNKKLISSIEDVIKKKGLTKNASATDFFSKFENLEKFKILESEKAIESAYIQSETTLRRNIKKTKTGKGKKSETRFVLSQLIQGTASYILKKSIIDVSKDEEIEFLIPMHDAVLYQVPTDKLEEKKKFIEESFIGNYAKLCPDINATVDFKPFED
jgi:DNA polymerase I-like protein with 3'-5' exonuclease and polymerase domains